EAIEEIRSIDPLIHGSIVKDKKTMKQSNNETMKIIAVEQHKNSIPYQKANYSLPLALVFGNETYGVTEETLKLADFIVEIPMYGINKSLNVIVSAAIVSYWVINPF
ncbi:MAG: TrmH family RNA methyltransferase, partial [Candidatus Roizmanbacteria bacterium]|nr:TrmH family RNA methyltransferase [Candidatus Roizmanbacteria bacterium]